MQTERNEESYDARKSDKDHSAKEQTIEYHLKAAHGLYCDEVRALKLRVKELKSKLQDALRCSQCESMKTSLEKQTLAFEEKFRGQNEIICELKHKLEFSENQTSNESFGPPTKHCAKKRKHFSRKDYLTLKLSQQLNPSSDDDVMILSLKANCGDQPFCPAEAFTESLDSELETQNAKNCLTNANFVFVPDTLVEDMGTQPQSSGEPNDKVVVVPETLHIDFIVGESPVFNNSPPQAVACHISTNDKIGSQRSPVRTQENPKNKRLINSRLRANNVNELEQQSKDHLAVTFCPSPNKNFNALVSDDLDSSMDEFQTEPTRKGKLSKPVYRCESQISKPPNGNSFVKKTAVARKVKTPSPRPKYRMHFSPARTGHRKPKYKQTTLTQNPFGGLPDSNRNRKMQDYELNKAIEESPHDHGQSHHNSRKACIELRQPTQKIAVERNERASLCDENDSCLDATFVSSQILRTRSTKHFATSMAGKSDTNDETDVDNFVDNASCSEDLIQQMLNQPSPKKGVSSKNFASKKGITSEQISVYEDFDIVPNNNNPSPNFKYKEPAVRKQNERRKLNGYECRECAAYVAALGLGDEEKKKRLKECSRHRGKFALPATPEHFWSIDFPSTEEFKERGVMNQTQYNPLQRRRRTRK